jgi:glutamate N-acetyltransferase/amino-acid N-acetyltransferase
MANNNTLTAPKGFRVAAVRAGIKASGNPDLGLIVADRRCNAAGVFSTNKIVSPTVTVSKAHVRSGYARAVYVNAGNANSCTGRRGHRDVLAICRQVATALAIKPEEVLVCSTGIIGAFLPMEKVHLGIDQSLDKLSPSEKMGHDLAKAIMTTDTRPKQAVRRIRLGSKTVTLAGIAKGAGMIDPNMATMLAFVTTDAAISSALLRRALKQAAGESFNKLNIDRHSSTNDSLLVLASGLAENRRITKSDGPYQKFARALQELCDDLTRQLAADAEGGTCVVKVVVQGAASQTDGRKAVRAIVDSPLVRAAFHGADPNWGRIVSAVGFSDARFKEEKLLCRIAGITVYRMGRPVKFDAKSLSQKMKAKSWDLLVHLGVGKHCDFCYTTDLSEEYITINADYHT